MKIRSPCVPGINTKRLFFPVLAGLFLTTLAARGDYQAKQNPTREHNPLLLFDGRLQFHVHERLRVEYRENNFDFNDSSDAVTDDSFLLQRFRLGVTGKPSKEVTIFLEGQDAREFDSDRANIPGVLGAEGDDEFDLRQGWMQLGDKEQFPIHVKVGRMAWNYGDQRLIGAFDWNNIGRTFDGLVLFSEWGKSRLDFFLGSPVIIKPDQFNTGDGHDRVGGLYFTTKEFLNQTSEVYLIHRNHDNAVNNGHPQEIWTPGLRVKSAPGKYGAFDYEAEVAGQAGTISPITNPTRVLDHRAFASHLEGGYTFRETMTTPRVSLFYDYASGDSNPNDGENTGFMNLFPTNHKFYGGMDLFAWRNIHDFGATVSATFFTDFTTRLEIHSFWLPETSDAWYRANGFTPVRAASAGRNVDSHVGEEIDLVANWKANKYVNLSAGYSHFFTGGFVEATGPSSDADFVYTMLTIQF
jgi:hypothetical protein